MTDRLTRSDVERVAELARLRLSEEQIEQYQLQLSTVLEHFATLSELELDDVEPLAHPIDLVNRLGRDKPQPSLPTDEVLRNAPAVEGPFFAVPKVLEDSGG